MISVQYGRKWNRKFRSGCENIVDESASRRLISFTDKTLKNIIRYCVPIEYGICYCSEYCSKKTEISKNMHSLDTTYTECRTAYVAICKKNLTRFQKERNTFRNCIVTGDESCCHFNMLTSKLSSYMEAQKFATCNKNKIKASARRVKLMCFFPHFWPCTGRMDA